MDFVTHSSNCLVIRYNRQTNTLRKRLYYSVICSKLTLTLHALITNTLNGYLKYCFQLFLDKCCFTEHLKIVTVTSCKPRSLHECPNMCLSFQCLLRRFLCNVFRYKLQETYIQINSIITLIILATRATFSYSLTLSFFLFPSLETESMSHTTKKEFIFLSNQI